MMTRLLLLLTAAVFSSSVAAGSVDDSLRFLQHSPDYVDLTTITGLRFDLRYATTNNFTGRNLYGEFNHPYLHRFAAAKLRRAAEILTRKHPHVHLLILDALRPRSVQYQLWNVVKGTPQQPYVADPEKGSIHNYGFAVDLTLVDDDGNELDMGTMFDDFTELAQPRMERKFVAENKLSEDQLKNRLILRWAMESAGFIQLPLEWWHYDALPKAEVKQNYPIIE